MGRQCTGLVVDFGAMEDQQGPLTAFSEYCQFALTGRCGSLVGTPVVESHKAFSRRQIEQARKNGTCCACRTNGESAIYHWAGWLIRDDICHATQSGTAIRVSNSQPARPTNRQQ